MTGSVTSYFTAAVIICFPLAFSADKDAANQRPHQVRAEVLNSTSIRLRWLPPKEEVVCPSLRYMIRLKEVDRSTGTNKARTWKINKTHQSAVVHDLRPNSVYLIRVEAENCESKWKSSRWITTKTSADKVSGRSTERIKDGMSTVVQQSGAVRSHRPPGQPRDIRTLATENSVFVSWQPPAFDGHAAVKGYVIGYGEGVPDVNWRYLDERQRNVTINNLKKSTQYVISVTALNDFGKSASVYDSIYTTDNSSTKTGKTQQPALPAPSDLRVQQLSTASVRLQWTDASLGVRQEIKDGRYYNVHYRATPSDGGRAMSILVKDLQVVLKDLVPSTRYEFRIRTIRDSQMSDFSQTISSRTWDDDEEEEQVNEADAEIAKEVVVEGESNEYQGRHNGEEDEDDLDEEVEEEEDEEEPDEEDDEEETVDTSRRTISSRSFYDQINVKDDTSSKKLNDNGGHKSRNNGESEAKGYINGTEMIKRFPEIGSLVKESVKISNVSSPSVARKRRLQSNRDSLFAVKFRSMVYHKVTAFITWPQNPQQSSCSPDGDHSPVVGYRLRYRTEDLDTRNHDSGRYVTSTDLKDNFLLLENLQPESRYRYQIQYLLGRNDSADESGDWSDEAVLDTHFSAAEP